MLLQASAKPNTFETLNVGGGGGSTLRSKPLPLEYTIFDRKGNRFISVKLQLSGHPPVK